MRAVIDTNVWVSGTLNPSGGPARILQAFTAHLFVAATTEPLLSELSSVLARPRIARKYGISGRDASELVALIRSRAEVVETVGTVHLCRDPDDDLVLETAMVGQCTFVVSRDEDLTRAEDLKFTLSAHGIELVTVRQFLDRIDRKMA